MKATTKTLVGAMDPYKALTMKMKMKMKSGMNS
jgi:hypothetical protein